MSDPYTQITQRNLDDHINRMGLGGPTKIREVSDVRPINKLLGELQTELGLLEDAWSDLFQHISPVLSPTPNSTDSSPKSQPEPAISLCASNLRDCIRRLQDTIYMIRTTTDRVEL